jgi:hypothetical protein
MFCENKIRVSRPLCLSLSAWRAIGGAASLLLFISATAAQAYGAPPAPAPATTPAKPEQPPKPDPEERMICRDQVITGSHIKTGKECHTKRDWDRMQNDTQDILDHQLRGYQPPK